MDSSWTNHLGMQFVWVPPDEFSMGSPETEAGRVREETQHYVNLTRGYYLGIHPVTQVQWCAVWHDVPKNNPSVFKGDDQPVGNVPWDYCVMFCERLSERDGKKYRLPTEAEWEYACRGCSGESAYCFGDDVAQLGDYAWYKANSGGETHPVGQKKPNALGLYDMHGNVQEWCSDWYEFDFYPSHAVRDPKGPETGTDRVLRGGSAASDADRVRCASRDICFMPQSYGHYVGFRVCLDSD